MFRQLQIALMLGLLLFSFSAYSAKPLKCALAVQSPAERHNAELRERYKQTEDFHHDLRIDSFKKAVAYFSEMLKGGSRTIDHALRFYNNSSFTFTVFERYKILIDRRISPEVRQSLDQKYSVLRDLSKKSGPFVDPKKPFDDRKLQLLELLQPQIDNLNVKKKKEAKNWQRATEYLIDLIEQNKNLTRKELYSLALILQGGEANHPAASAKFLNDLDINYMFIPKGDGKLILDPMLSFLPGSVKSDALNDFFKWLEKNEKKMNPVELAAQARMMIVSIHPIPDGNGRLARLVANYILMRAGLPPAAIPRGDDGSMSVVLFPLKKFSEQIAPEKSYRIMLEGVLRSQQFLMGTGSEIYP